MDLTNLRKIIAIHTAIGGNSSLPFAIKRDDKLCVRWFSYDMERKETNLYLTIKHVFTLDDTGRVNFITNVGTKYTLIDYAAMDDFNESEYYSRLAQLFNENDKEGMDALLEFAETPSSLKIYNDIAKL